MGFTILNFLFEAMHRLEFLRLVVLLVFHVSRVVTGDVVETLVERSRCVVSRLYLALEFILVVAPGLLEHQSISCRRLLFFNFDLQIHHGQDFITCRCWSSV